jgi:transposase
MTYSVDLRERVVKFVRGGGSKSEAARKYNVCRSAVYDWLRRETLEPKKQGRRKRKLDWVELENHINSYPDFLLRERAEHFGVRIFSIQYACAQLGISHKKNSTVQRKKL